MRLTNVLPQQYGEVIYRWLIDRQTFHSRGDVSRLTISGTTVCVATLHRRIREIGQPYLIMTRNGYQNLGTRTLCLATREGAKLKNSSVAKFITQERILYLNVTSPVDLRRTMQRKDAKDRIKAGFPNNVILPKKIPNHRNYPLAAER